MKFHMLSYAHSDPLYESIKNKLKVKRCTPMQAMKDVLDGACEAATVSLIPYLKNSDSLKLLPTANIHTMSTTGSTLLISDGSPIKRDMEIAVTGATSTTMHYLSIILKRMKINFRLKHSESQEADSLLAECNYALVIGDEALKVYSSGHRILLDTGFEFSRLFGKAPLYAVTVSSDNYEGNIAEEINSAMGDHFKFNGNCASNASERLGVSRRIMQWYYNLIKYDHGDPVNGTLDYIRNSV